jgi:hypothetical protein
MKRVLVFSLLLLCFSYSLKRNFYQIRSLDPISLKSDTKEIIEYMDYLQSSATIEKWSKAKIDPSLVTKIQLDFVSRNYFSSIDYFSDILNGVTQTQTEYETIEKQYFALSVVFIFLSIFIIPLTTLSDSAKNLIGILSIFSPFLIIFVNIFSPSFFRSTVNATNTKKQKEIENERILYHEAGHFLIGYLCGLPVLQYNVNVNINFNSNNNIGNKNEKSNDETELSVGAYLPNLEVLRKENKSKKQILIESNIAKLLIISMAGVVAETFRFGNSKGFFFFFFFFFFINF